ncbi:MAG: UbiA-like protein EboC [Cyclobacteriaceae bacterium]
MKNKIIGYLRLMRPANIVTAVADILAGIAISGFLITHPSDFSPLVWLILSTIGLYGGGVVMNDVFDSALDKVERPERPIPSGLISRSEASALGITLLVIGIYFAFLVSDFSGLLALIIAAAALVYNRWSKHHVVLGPLNMGICRGLNLVLGLSIIPSQVAEYWFLAIIPVIYIAAITMISQGEVYGGKRMTLIAAAGLYLLAMVGILYISFLKDQMLTTLAFVVLWALMVFLPLQRAMRLPQGKLIGKAVKAGVLALILMNAAWASAFGVTYLALIIILLLPLSLLLAKVFAVT